jgi:uncharacterized protein YbjT (DUF2867 family)
MKIIIIGGTGLIGSKVVAKLAAHGHDAVAASPRSGVNTYTNEGVIEALTGADVVVDVSNSPSFDDADDFFKTTTQNLLTAEKETGVRHHVALSVVGSDRMTDSPYMQAKVAQEQLIHDSGVPFSLVHATQFFEFAAAMAENALVDGVVHAADALVQPVAAEDVATVVARTAAHDPLNGVTEITGPEALPMHVFFERALAAKHDDLQVIVDSKAPYFGQVLQERMLLAGPDAQHSNTTFDAFLASA